jgi:hypothetical protein
MKKIWRIWCLTMGEKISDDNNEADVASLIRTFFWTLNVITCFFIIANVIRHWN